MASLHVDDVHDGATFLESRSKEAVHDCWRCESGLEKVIWHDDSWLVGQLPKPSGLPVVVLLYPKAHHDIDDLPSDLVGELGPLLIRVEGAVRSVGHIGRVHIGRGVMAAPTCTGGSWPDRSGFPS